MKKITSKNNYIRPSFLSQIIFQSTNEYFRNIQLLSRLNKNRSMFTYATQYYLIVQIYMSIIRQVNWDEFTKLVGNEEFQKFTETGFSIVLFITDWSFPSRLALKRLKKLYFDKKRCGIVDADLVDSIQLINKYDIKSVPFCMTFQDGQIQQALAGYRIQTLVEMFAPLVSQYHTAHPPVSQNCPKGHQIEIVTELPPEIYLQGYLYCNRCRKIERCQKQKPAGHCSKCDYDLCFECLKSSD